MQHMVCILGARFLKGSFDIMRNPSSQDQIRFNLFNRVSCEKREKRTSMMEEGHRLGLQYPSAALQFVREVCQTGPAASNRPPTRSLDERYLTYIIIPVLF